jgi:hypothetical protein
MTMDPTSDRTEMARAHLDEAREHYEAFCEAMRALGREVRALDEWQWQRVDAYPGWDGSRDVGGGIDMLGWLAEIATFLDGQDDALDAREAHGRFRPCARCGQSPAAHNHNSPDSVGHDYV